MRDIDLIHALTFDFTFAATQSESVEVADWVKADLLPVIEQVLDRYRGGGRRHIDRLEIDLGTVSAAHAHGELPQRLFAQLSTALEEVLHDGGAAVEGADQARRAGADLLAFLETGTMPWTGRGDANAAHTTLLQQVIDSPQAHGVLSVALGQAPMLTRLIRQFDEQLLWAAAQTLFGAWPSADRTAALAWAREQLRRVNDAPAAVEPFWRWFLQQHAQPASPATLLTRWSRVRVGEGAHKANLSANVESSVDLAADVTLIANPPANLAGAPSLGAAARLSAGEMHTLGAIEPGDEAQLSATLREVLEAADAANTTRLRQLIGSARAHGVLSLALGNASTLTRLIRHFDAPELWAVAQTLLSTWTPAQRSDALAWAKVELRRVQDAAVDAEPFWRWFLQQHAQPASPATLLTRWNRVRVSEGVNETNLQAKSEASMDLARDPTLIGSAASMAVSPYGSAASQPGASEIRTILTIDQGREAHLSATLRELLEATDAAPKTMLRQVIDSGHAHGVLSLALGNPSTLTALIRRCDAGELWAVAQTLLSTWTPEQRSAALAWGEDELRRVQEAAGDAEPFWRWFLQQHAQPVSPATLLMRWHRVRPGALAQHHTLSAQTGANAEPDATETATMTVATSGTAAGRLGASEVSTIDPGVDGQSSAALDELLEGAEAGHKAVLRQVLDSRHAHSVLSSVLGEAPMLARLIRQFDAQELWAAAQTLFSTWPAAERTAALDWAGDELRRVHDAGGGGEAFWRWFLQQHAQAESPATLRMRWDRVRLGQVAQQAYPGADAAAGEAPHAKVTMGETATASMGQIATESMGEIATATMALAATGTLAGRLGATEMSIIEEGLERADFALLAPYWDRILASAPQCLRRAQLLHWNVWLQRFDAATLADILSVLQGDCAWLIERLATVVPRARLNALLLPAMPQWLGAPVDSLAPQSVLDWVKAALPEQSERIAALFTMPDARDDEKEGTAAHGPHGAMQEQSDEQLLASARALFSPWPQAQRDAAMAWAGEELRQLRAAGVDSGAFWRWFLPQCAHPVGIPAFAQQWQRQQKQGQQTTEPQQPQEQSQQQDEKREQERGLEQDQELEQELEQKLEQELAPNEKNGHAAGRPHGAVDSRHFREALRMLGPIFTRAEIITISKCLNTGEFGPLAPYWDRLLILAPFWLRMEYPRLASTWLRGFDDEVLIDILSVVQAECCELIEQLAGVLPRTQLHEALRPALARWFAIHVDALAPQAFMDDVLRAAPGTHIKLQAMPGAQASDRIAHVVTDTNDADGAAQDWLEELLQRGDVAQLRRMWPSIVMSQRARFRQLWAQLSSDNRHYAIERFTAGLSLTQQVDVAVMLQPAVAVVMAELQRMATQRTRLDDVLASAVRYLLHADVASAEPAQLMQCVLDRHADLAAELSSVLVQGEMRHLAAAVPATRQQVTAHQRAAALALAYRTEQALRAFVAACLSEDAQLSQLDSAQLHALVQAWTRFQQQGGEAGGAFLTAIETGALRSAEPHAFFGSVLQQALLGDPIDLDEIEALCGAPVPAPLGLPTKSNDAAGVQPADSSAIAPVAGGQPADSSAIAPVAGGQPADSSAIAPVAGGPSPLPDVLYQALPRRLADAMLRADLSALGALWPDIVKHHPALLGQAAQRYLMRSDARKRLIASAAADKMHDLLGCVSAWAARLVAPLLANAERFSMMLPTPLASAEFQQRVLRYAFAQALENPATTEAEWVTGLLRAVLPAQAPQADTEPALVANVWYEALRDGDTSLKAALEHALLGSDYAAVALRRVQADPAAEVGSSLPDTLQHMLTVELCSRHPALTDQLLADGNLAGVKGAVFSVVEWQALAQAQLPRQERALQQAFWREYSAHLPASVPGRGLRDEDVQEAFAAAFGVLGRPAAQAPGGPELARTQSDTSRAVAGTGTLAILLMRASAPDDATKAGIKLLTQALLADSGSAAGPAADATARAALHSALSHRQARNRLLTILAVPTMARLLCVLQPKLAAALPTVLRDLRDALSIPLSAVPATLDCTIWRAIFDAIYSGSVPTSGATLLDALVERLAIEPAQVGAAMRRQADQLAVGDASAADVSAASAAPGVALNATLTPALTPALTASLVPALAPALAMAQLLQPLARPQPGKPAAPAARSDDTPLPFAGDANLRNAGLVIIAPYIERLFALLDITRDGVFASDEARERGVHLLQYVVTAEESTPEYLLGLNKLLCGIPAVVPVALGISMTDKEKNTIDQMLKGVIGHWSAIGSSTVTGLRETFLQREGSLYYQDEAWHLKIPQGTFDMLLDRLPWGYKMIKFSWMAAPLNVTWR